MLKLKRMWIQLTADRQRFGVLCAMLAMGLLLWARLIVVTNMPRQAIAVDPLAPNAAVAAETPVYQPRRPPLEVHLEDTPRRNPFLISRRYFPKPTPVARLTPDEGKSGATARESRLVSGLGS